MPGSRPDLQYITIEDFSHGIYSDSGYTVTGAVQAPLGSADATQTYRCRSSTSGALIPGPGQYMTFTAPVPDSSNVNNSGQFYVTGVVANGNEAYANDLYVAGGGGAVNPANAFNFPDEIIFAVQYNFNNGAGGSNPTQQRTRIYRLQTFAVTGLTPGSTPTADTLFSLNASSNASHPLAGYTRNYIIANSHAIQRINLTDNTKPGFPTVCIDQNIGNGSTESGIILFPNPNTQGVVSIYQYTTAHLDPGLVSSNANVLGHQGRVVGLFFEQYTGPGTNYVTNEEVSFSDPPNGFNATLSGQREVFVNETPVGYGAWGSQSAAELFLVKHSGGAVYVSGDIANPSITKLPGVVSTSGCMNQAASSTLGIIYATFSDGVYAWNGGNSSQKISRQLEDNFWVIPAYQINGLSGAGFPFNQGINFQAENWDDLVICSNNWILDTTTGAWWRLDNPTGTTQYQRFAKSFQGSLMYCGVASYTSATASTALAVYNRSIPATSYRWQSHPIPATQRTLVDVLDVILLARGAGTVTVSLVDTNNNVVSLTPVTVSGSIPQRFHLPAGTQSYNMAVRIDSTATSTGPAPMVHSLALGYTEGPSAGLR
jgi:hypothetical protein